MRLLASSVAVLIPLLAAGQSMSDTAQKERERREKQKAAGASAAVITEESLKANKGSLANDPGAAKSGAGKTARPNSRPGAAPAAPVPSKGQFGCGKGMCG